MCFPVNHKLSENAAKHVFHLTLSPNSLCQSSEYETNLNESVICWFVFHCVPPWGDWAFRALWVSLAVTSSRIKAEERHCASIIWEVWSQHLDFFLFGQKLKSLWSGCDRLFFYGGFFTSKNDCEYAHRWQPGDNLHPLLKIVTPFAEKVVNHTLITLFLLQTEIILAWSEHPHGIFKTLLRKLPFIIHIGLGF